VKSALRQLASVAMALGAVQLCACEPQDIHLFDRVAPDAGSPVNRPLPPPDAAVDPSPDPAPPARAQPACESAECERCVLDALCGSGALPLLCHPQTGDCLLACDPEPGAEAPLVCPSTLSCEPRLGLCVECVTALDCGGALRSCDSERGVCVGCMDDAACSPSAPACDIPNQRCVECTEDSHCPTGVCQISRFSCVECLSNADCPALGGDDDDELCHPELLTCVECLSNADCQRSDPDKPICKEELECDDES
jgi:Cys-rich repeat protein